MIEKITDQNLERYDSRLKEWCDRKFFEKGSYGKYQTTEEAGAVAFYPAPNTPLEGKVKFSFKETMPSEGEKGPENPSTITGMSQVKVTRCGKNIVKLPFFEGLNPVTKNGITFTPSSDGSIVVSGTASSTVFYTVFYVFGTMRIGKTYTLSGCPSGGSSTTYAMRFGVDTNSYDTGNGCTKTLTGNDNTVVIRINSGYTANNLVFRPQLELGSTATSFELYSGADFAISLGGTYYGGSIDLATGVMTVTHEGIVIPRINIENASGTEYSGVFNLLVYDLRTNNKQADVFSYNESSGFNSSNYFCNYYPWERSGAVANTFHVSANFAFLSISGSSVENARQNLLSVYDAAITNDNPISFVYPLATPFIVQLTPQQIKSLAQSDKYTPRLNTVYTDADSIQISYLKSPIRDEYEKTQAILSLGGNS